MAVSKLLAVVVLLGAVVWMCKGAAIMRKRDVAEGSSQAPGVRICFRTTPCMFASYEPGTHRILQYMPNRCVCGAGLECVRTGEFVPTGAYVYTCVAPETPAPTPETPAKGRVTPATGRVTAATGPETPATGPEIGATASENPVPTPQV